MLSVRDKSGIPGHGPALMKLKGETNINEKLNKYLLNYSCD